RCRLRRGRAGGRGWRPSRESLFGTTERHAPTGHLVAFDPLHDHCFVESWEPTDDMTLIMQVLHRMEAQLFDIGENVIRVRTLLERKMAKKKKKISLSREFYERHEWIQRNLAERIELHRKLREQRTQQQERD